MDKPRVRRYRDDFGRTWRYVPLDELWRYARWYVETHGDGDIKPHQVPGAYPY